MKVFLSSTVYELIDLRSELYEFLTATGYEVVMSEIGTSEFDVKPNQSSIECCLTNVRQCDVLILIADRRYGPTLEKFGYDKRSATHLEYDEAIKAKVPVYVYLRDRTDAELSLYKSATKIKVDWKKEDWTGEWVTKGNIGLLEMLSEHQKLKQKDDHNWLTVFRTSVDLKQAIANHLRSPRYNHDLTRLIASGDVPILDVKGSFEYIDGQICFKAIIQNKGKFVVFIKVMEWSDLEPNDLRTNDKYTLFSPNYEESVLWLYPIESSTCYYNKSFILIYSTYDGFTVEERWIGYYSTRQKTESKFELIDRKFRVEHPINMHLEN